MLKPPSPKTASSQARRDTVLVAALQRFSHYGYRRTSMEDIAQEAGLSRAALYLHFKNKDEIFRALALGLNQQAIDAAEQAARTEGPIALRITQVLEAKVGTFFEIVHGSAHARELLDENNRVCGDISAAFRDKHLIVLRRVVSVAARQHELMLAPTGLSANAAAELLLDCAKGLELSPEITPTAFRRRLRQMVQVLVRGLGETSTAKTKR